MNRVFCFIILIAFCLVSCKTNNPDFSEKVEKQITDSLKNVATSFLRSWEPPFNSEKALSLFTQSDDFYLVIDGLVINSYSKWAEGVPNFMSDDNFFFKSYKHEIQEIRTVVLSANSGVVTIAYIWDNISKDDVHKNVNGVITLTCRYENKNWKIVHYHGSHGEERVIK